MSAHVRSSSRTTQAPFAGRRPVAARWPLLTVPIVLLLAAGNGLASTPRTTQFQVNTIITSSQDQPAVAADSAGNFVVVWQSYGSGGDDSSGRSIQARLVSADGTLAGSEFQVNTSTANDQSAPAVAMSPSGAFVVVWASNHNSASGYDIMAQRFNAAGAKVGSELLVNSAYTAGDQLEPAVAMAADGDFVVVWRSPVGAGGDPGVSIQGRRFRASSGTFFDQFLVNDVTSGDQDEPAIACDGSLTYLAAWRQPASSNDIAIRSFTADDLVAEGLTADSPQQTANTYPSGSQTAPSVAMAPDRRAVVAWESFGASFGSDTSRISVQARRIDSDGAFLDGNDVQINTYTNDDQRFPSATISPDGHWAVAWQSYGSAGNDSSDYSIQLRAFAASGNALDAADVQVNTYTSNAQQYPAAALAANGRMLVAWESNGSPGTDTNGLSVQARLYDVYTPSTAVALPAVARVQGSGAFFTSRIDLLSSASAVRQVAVTYIPRADLGGATRTAMVPLPAGVQLEVTDPLAAWFGFSGSEAAVGSLLLELRDGSGAASTDQLFAQSVVFARKTDGSGRPDRLPGEHRRRPGLPGQRRPHGSRERHPGGGDPDGPDRLAARGGPDPRPRPRCQPPAQQHLQRVRHRPARQHPDRGPGDRGQGARLRQCPRRQHHVPGHERPDHHPPGHLRRARGHPARARAGPGNQRVQRLGERHQLQRRKRLGQGRLLRARHAGHRRHHDLQHSGRRHRGV